MKLFDTTLPQNFSKGLFEEKNFDLAAEHTDKILYTAFVGTSTLLSGAKSKDRPTAFIFEKIDSEIIAAAIVQCIPDETAGTEKWNLVWTFDAADIPENALRISLKDPNTHSYFRAIAGDKWGIRFKDVACLTVLLTYSLEQLKKWLDENALEDKEVSIELEGVFQARVGVEDGQKVFALEPDGQVKRLIKDDASIEQ